MASEREEVTFKNGGRIVLTKGEDGVTVNISGFGKPMMGTYNDIQKLTKDIGKYLRMNYSEAFLEDRWGTKVPEQDRDLHKLAIRLRRIDPTWTKPYYLTWLDGH